MCEPIGVFKWQKKSSDPVHGDDVELEILVVKLFSGTGPANVSVPLPALHVPERKYLYSETAHQSNFKIN